MLSSLTPVGEGSRGQRWTVTVVAFTIGGALGGAATGLLAGGLGQVLAAPADAALALLGIGAAGALLGDLRGPTPPSRERQVDRTWMTRYRGWVYGLGYGVQLGCGLVTYVSSWATWLWVLVLVLVADLPTALALGILHGLVRAASLWTTARLTSPDAIRAHHRRLQELLPMVRRGSTALLAVTAVAAVVVGLAGAAT